MPAHNFEQKKARQPEVEDNQASEQKQGLSRRELMAGMLAMAIFSGKTKEAAAYLQKEANEQQEGPKIEIEIFYSAHVTGKDIEGLAEKIRENDVFVPEFSGEHKALLDILSDLSEGKRSPQELSYGQGAEPEETEEGFEPFYAALAKAIYNTHKFISIFDVPAGHLLYDRLKHVGDHEIQLTMPFEQLIATRKRQRQEFANLNTEREQLMLRRLMYFKKELGQGAIPHLRGKNPVKILLFLGTAHTRIYHELKKRGETVSRKFPRMPYAVAIDTEVMRHFFFGKEPSDDLLAKDLLGAVLNAILDNHFSEISADTQLRIRFLRKAVKIFNFQEIKNIFDAMREEGGISEETALNIIGLMRQRGIAIPESEEEMKKIVGYK